MILSRCATWVQNDAADRAGAGDDGARTSPEKQTTLTKRAETGWEVDGEEGELDKGGDEAETTRYLPESTAVAKWTKAPGDGSKTNAGSVSRTGRRQFHQKYATPNKEQT
jgi:hypothetical protein